MSQILICKPVRPATSNQAPHYGFPLTCDCHFHVFEAGYPHVEHPHYTFPDASLAQYLWVCDHLGIERMVLVQPSFYGTDNRLLLDALRRLGNRARGVAMVEEDISDNELDELHQAGVRAIRLDLFARADWDIARKEQYITHMMARARSRGWHTQFYTPGYVLRDILPLLAMIEEPFVIDHMGYMLEEDGLTQADFARLLNLMTTAGCWLKLSGPYRIAKKRGYDAVAHLARAIVEAAPDRAIWGSDWPHLPDGTRDTGELFNLLAEWAPDEHVRRKVLVDNPARLFQYN